MVVAHSRRTVQSRDAANGPPIPACPRFWPLKVITSSTRITRGSYGQGEAFTRANVKDFGGGDLNDILTGVDYVVAHNPIDPNRLGVTGWRLRRLHDYVGRHPNASVPCGSRWRRPSPTGPVTTVRI